MRPGARERTDPDPHAPKRCDRTLALMVLKTLEVLGPLHGYGIARRIEQISGDESTTAWRRSSTSTVDEQTADNIRAGLSPDEARRQALLKFESVEAMKERYRDERGLTNK
jgi:hypothetical protein